MTSVFNNNNNGITACNAPAPLAEMTNGHASFENTLRGATKDTRAAKQRVASQKNKHFAPAAVSVPPPAPATTRRVGSESPEPTSRKPASRRSPPPTKIVSIRQHNPYAVRVLSEPIEDIEENTNQQVISTPYTSPTLLAAQHQQQQRQRQAAFNAAVLAMTQFNASAQQQMLQQQQQQVISGNYVEDCDQSVDSVGYAGSTPEATPTKRRTPPSKATKNAPPPNWNAMPSSTAPCVREEPAPATPTTPAAPKISRVYRNGRPVPVRKTAE